jgi:oligoribonuclease NrnB/cAMP/cGMP phosphodiesterase (DHH superfamily)
MVNQELSSALSAPPLTRPRYLQLFTHDDLDGVGCAVIFKAKFGLDANATYCNYTTFNTKIANYLAFMNSHKRTGLLMITDASITPETAALVDEYIALGGQAVLLDHHTNGAEWQGQPYLEWITTKPWAHVDKLRCGTQLAYDYLLPSPTYAPFAALVQNYDVSGWIPKPNGDRSTPSPQAKELNQLRYLIGKETFAARFAADPGVEFREGERLVLDLDHRTLDNYRKEVEASAIVLEPNALGQRFAVAFCDRYTTDVAHMLMDDLKLDGVVLLDIYHRKISFRSHEGVDVGSVAQVLGGGGHTQAAGITMEAPAIAKMMEPLNDLLINLGRTVSNLSEEFSGPGGPERFQAYLKAMRTSTPAESRETSGPNL